MSFCHTATIIFLSHSVLESAYRCPTAQMTAVIGARNKTCTNRVTRALEHVGAIKELVALDAMKCLHAPPDLPEDLFPGHSLLFHELDHLLGSEIFILFVLSDLLAIGIDENLSLFAYDLICEFSREKRLALDAETKLSIIAIRTINQG